MIYSQNEKSIIIRTPHIFRDIEFYIHKDRTMTIDVNHLGADGCDIWISPEEATLIKQFLIDKGY